MPSRKSKKWIDVTVGLKNGMAHWPGDPEVVIARSREIDGNSHSNLTHISMSAHTATHMDAPLHFIDGAKSIDAIPLDATIGPARVVGIRNRSVIDAPELCKHRIRKGERIIFKTRNSSRCWKTDEFVKDYVYIAPDAARLLAEKKVCCVGIDYLSVGPYEGGAETHRILLSAGIWIIEGLNLSRVTPGRYDLVCLPLKIIGSDGAPCRVVVRER